MKPIPKELKGTEVKKFEDLIKDKIDSIEKWVDGYKAPEVIMEVLNNYFQLTWIYEKFLNQDFTPDMIEEYFDVALLVEDSSMTDSFCLTIGKITDKHLTDYKALIFKPRPETLSDFIDCCLNSGIKLKWRE